MDNELREMLASMSASISGLRDEIASQKQDLSGLRDAFQKELTGLKQDYRRDMRQLGRRMEVIGTFPAPPTGGELPKRPSGVNIGSVSQPIWGRRSIYG